MPYTLLESVVNISGRQPVTVAKIHRAMLSPTTSRLVELEWRLFEMITEAG